MARYACDIPVPRFDRSRVTPGIGNFHRAHEAVYIDDLMDAGEALD